MVVIGYNIIHWPIMYHRQQKKRKKRKTSSYVLVLQIHIILEIYNKTVI